MLKLSLILWFALIMLFLSSCTSTRTSGGNSSVGYGYNSYPYSRYGYGIGYGRSYGSNYGGHHNKHRYSHRSRYHLHGRHYYGRYPRHYRSGRHGRR